MARGGRYSSIPLILICTRQRKKGKYIPTDTVDYRKMSERMPRQRGVCFSVVSEHIRRQNVAENEMNSNEKIAQRAEKGENVCTKVILWNWQEEH